MINRSTDLIDCESKSQQVYSLEKTYDFLVVIDNSRAYQQIVFQYQSLNRFRDDKEKEKIHEFDMCIWYGSESPRVLLPDSVTSLRIWSP